MLVVAGAGDPSLGGTGLVTKLNPVSHLVLQKRPNETRAHAREVTYESEMGTGHYYFFHTLAGAGIATNLANLNH